LGKEQEGMLNNRQRHVIGFVLAAQILVALSGCRGAPTGRQTLSFDGVVEGWAVLAEKDDYSGLHMADLSVDYIDVVRLRRVLESAGWAEDHILELREFDYGDLQDGLDWLAQNADGDDIAFLYVAAHGTYLNEVLGWEQFFAAEWREIHSQRRVLVVAACQAGEFTRAVERDPSPYLSVATVARNELSWCGLPEEGLPIIGNVFTYYFAASFSDPTADADGDGFVSVQEAAAVAEAQQRTYMHEVVFAVPQFLAMYTELGASPENDPSYPHVVVDDAIGEPLPLALDAYR
jgi:hypothetical protein